MPNPAQAATVLANPVCNCQDAMGGVSRLALRGHQGHSPGCVDPREHGLAVCRDVGQAAEARTSVSER